MQTQNVFFSWMQFLLQNPNQSVVRAGVDGAVAFRQGRYIQRWQSIGDNRPARRFAVVPIEALSKRTGENVMRRHEHGVGIDFEGCSSFLEGLKTPGAIQSDNPPSIGSDDPFITGANNRRDPIVF